MELEPATPTLSIELNIDCPKCANWFDLIADTDLNDEGRLIDMALPKGCWVDEHKKFECNVVCPECGHEFVAKGVNW